MRNDSAQAPQERFQQAVARAEEAARLLLQGDPAPFRQLYSQRDDVTLYGGEGGRLQGFATISRQLDWLTEKTPAWRGGVGRVRVPRDPRGQRDRLHHRNPARPA